MLLGKGAYASVYRENQRAVKKIKLTPDGIPINALTEITILKTLSQCHYHDHIITLYDVSMDKQYIALTLELADMDLKKYLKLFYPLNKEVLLNIFKQIAMGVSACHDCNIIHRDIKPENVLMVGSLVKLCDFGISKMLYKPTTLKDLEFNIVTLWYRAPEILLHQYYHKPIDIWSLGCVLYELYRNIQLYKGRNEKEQLELIYSTKVNTSDVYIYNLIINMLNLNQYERPDIKQVLQM
jgi:serine/threonine protein kinase